MIWFFRWAELFTLLMFQTYWTVMFDDAHIWQAERFIKQQKKRGLIEISIDDNKCVAMTVYTMEGQPRETSVYFQLNKVVLICFILWLIWLIDCALGIDGEKSRLDAALGAIHFASAGLFAGIAICRTSNSVPRYPKTYFRTEGKLQRGRRNTGRLVACMHSSAHDRYKSCDASLTYWLVYQWAAFSSTATSASVLQNKVSLFLFILARCFSIAAEHLVTHTCSNLPPFRRFSAGLVLAPCLRWSCFDPAAETSRQNIVIQFG